MLVATFMSFLARTSACLAELLSKPIATNVAMESSDGSGTEDLEADGWFLSILRPGLEGKFLMTFPLGDVRDELPEDHANHAKDDDMNSGNLIRRIPNALIR